ncbi:TRAP transporter substrate-binding protein [Peribacillus asahii]|uniref:TRAP transporter substrate-binding protein n=1 Tax=Peribacillus asahii TaxID=228899 RepID=UPI00207A53DA|nr:TRAP transporter substrate-binding protein DctP [Peribacillus asahii]USK68700.1 TRAP transporter substrate-binding protein DctP [Peribacillus asahii]
MIKRSKLSFYSLTSIIIVVMLILAACGGNETANSGGESAQKPINLTFGMAVPATHPLNALAAEPWAETVKEETDGLVEVDIQPGAVLGPSSSVLQDVSGGVYDIGFVVGQSFPDTPLFKTTVLNLPFAYINTDDHLLKAKIAQRFVDEYINKDLEKLGIKVMGIYTSDPAVLISQEPIRTVDDLKGKQTQLQAPSWLPLLSGWGASPVSVAIEDIYTSLERGTLDVAVYAYGGAYSQKFYEPGPFITNLPISTVAQAVVMNLDKWNSMSPELRKKFEETFNPNLEELLNISYSKGEKESYEKIKKEVKGKGEIIQPSEEELKRFIKPAKDVWKQWVKEADKKGYNGQELLDGLLRIMEEEGVEPPFEI